MKYFGTDGFRGKVNETLCVDHALKTGQYLGWYFSKKFARKARCLIGKDTRLSSYMFEYALAAGLTAGGADVSLMHVTTTPSVSYVTRTEDFDFGIMITASHNPYYDNGIKIIDNDGYKMTDDVLALVEDYIDGKCEIELATSNHVGRIVDYLQGRNRYISYLASVPMHSFRGYKIGLDCANGASSNIAKTVFDMLGADTYVINNTPNGLNINEDAGSTHIENMVSFVKDKGLDVGFSFDGDADRCLCVDEKGNIVDGDSIIYIASRFMKERNQLIGNTAVITVMSNIGLIKALGESGINHIMTDVGDKYVSKEIQDNSYSIGGEQSGHIIFNKYSTTGDGILTALIMTDIMAERKQPFSHLSGGLKIYPQKLKNITVDNKDAIMADPSVKAIADQANKELEGNGRMLLRASGTEPKVRIMVEAETDDICDKYIKMAEEVILAVK